MSGNQLPSLFSPRAMLFDDPPRRVVIEVESTVDATVGRTFEVDLQEEVEIDEESTGVDSADQGPMMVPPMDLTNFRVQVENNPSAGPTSKKTSSRRQLPPPSPRPPTARPPLALPSARPPSAPPGPQTQ